MLFSDREKEMKRMRVSSLSLSLTGAKSARELVCRKENAHSHKYSFEHEVNQHFINAQCLPADTRMAFHFVPNERHSAHRK